MLFFIYAIIGMQIFGNIKLDSSTAINRHNHFQNFLVALLLLFRCATGEGWQEIMQACLSGATCEKKPSELNKTKPLVVSNTCGSDFSYAYFCSFIFFSTFLMLNLFVAVIMDNFDYLTRDSSILGAHHLDEFLRAWSELDPSGDGKIHFRDVYKLLLNMEPPVGFGKKCPRALAYKRLIRMNIPCDDQGFVHFKTTFIALIRESLSIKNDNFDERNDELRDVIKIVWPMLKREELDLLVPPKESLFEKVYFYLHYGLLKFV